MLKISSESFKKFSDEAVKSNTYIEGSILKLLEATTDNDKQYLEKAKALNNEKLRKTIKLNKTILDSKRELEKLMAETQLKNNKLEEQAEGVRSFKLDMEKLKLRTNFKMEKLKANNQSKLISLAATLIFVYFIIRMALIDTMPEIILGGLISISTFALGFLKGAWGQKEENKEPQQEYREEYKPDNCEDCQ